jgi:hypothetical protein
MSPVFYATEHDHEALFDRYGVISTRPLWRDALLDVLDGRSLLRRF